MRFSISVFQLFTVVFHAFLAYNVFIAIPCFPLFQIAISLLQIDFSQLSWHPYQFSGSAAVFLVRRFATEFAAV